MLSSTERQITPGEFVSRDARETFELGKQIGDELRGGEILLLDGPLGAGKTIFVKGVAAALDIDPEEVTSPSFTLVNPYAGRLQLFHLDLFRL
ncbi:MAG: tRNA (adenosine(37)-N6)-threonylcarbamoyltransferase complex ATPase subunit type 1 TsaE, partial [Pyrinomonadaceae bacterium]